MNIIPCNYCGSTESKIIHHLSDFLLGNRDVQSTFVECSKCGLVFQNPQPTKQELVKYYPTEYEPFNTEEHYLYKSWIYRLAYRFGIWKRCKLVLEYKKSGKLLDIGCAKGLFLQGMEKHRYWELFGLEINPQVAHFAREKYGLNVRVGDLENAKFPADFFDVITLWDVLEHIPNPTSHLEEILRILKSNGILVLRIPNYDSWESKFFRRYWAGLDAPRHLYVFSPDTITKFLKKSKFKVLSRNTRSGGYSTFLLSLRFWLFDQGINHKFRDFTLSILSSPISRFLFFPLFFLSGLRLRGSVLTIVAVKNHT